MIFHMDTPMQDGQGESCIHNIIIDFLVWFNAFHAAGECRRQVKNVTNLVKNVTIVEFHDYIWNHREKYIQNSTNMPSIGSLIREIDVT